MSFSLGFLVNTTQTVPQLKEDKLGNLSVVQCSYKRWLNVYYLAMR
jgi:hypothetical protein